MRFFGRWLLVAGWMGVIFALSARPIIVGGELQLWDFVTRKAAHVMEYLILYLLLLRASGKPKGAFMAALLYAFSDEMHQLFVPGRTGKISDVLMFDFLGIVIGYILSFKYKRLWR